MTHTEAMSEIKQQALVDINEAQNEKEIQDVKDKYLGIKGSVTGLMKHMKELTNEQKPSYSQKINEVRQAIEGKIESQSEILANEKLEQQLKNEKIDVTLPSRKISIGAKHPLTRTIEEIEDLFLGLGY